MKYDIKLEYSKEHCYKHLYIDDKLIEGLMYSSFRPLSKDKVELTFKFVTDINNVNCYVNNKKHTLQELLKEQNYEI